MIHKKIGVKYKFFMFLTLIIILLSVSFLSLLSIKSASAVGIAGSNDFMIFEPYLNRTYSYVVISNTDKVMDHGIGIDGDLAPHAHLSTNVLEDIPINGQASFTMELNLPESLEPGLHTLTLCAVESTTRGAGGGGETSIGTRAAVCLMIRVLSLYPEKLADFDFYAPDVASGGIEEFTLDVRSLSEQDFYIKGKVDVYTNATGSLVKLVTLYSDEKNLKSGKNEKLVAYLDTKNFEIGDYLAKATLYYDDKAPVKEQKFKIGDLSMVILNFSDAAYSNRVNELSVFVLSNWNSEIKGVYAEMAFTNGDFTTIITSPTESFNAWQIKPLTLFLDTKNMKAGEYNVYITLHYAEKTTVVNGKFKVINKIDITPQTILLTGVIILLIVILVFIVWFTRKKMKELEKKFKKRR